MGAGPPSCTVFRAALLLIHNLSQTPAWSTPGDHRVPVSLVQSRLRSEHLTQAGAPFPVSTWMKDQPGREKKEEVCAFVYGQISLSHCPPVACLPLSSRRQAKPISLLSASGKREASQTPSLKRKWRRVQARTCSLGSELKSVHCVHRKRNLSWHQGPRQCL